MCHRIERNKLEKFRMGISFRLPVCDITNHRNELAYHHADCSVCFVGMDDTGFKKIVKQKGA